MIHPPALPYAEYAEAQGTHEWVVFESDVRIARAQPTWLTEENGGLVRN